MSQEVSTSRVTLSRLIKDPNLQVRKRLDQVTINRYADVYKADNEMPPIKVALVDGKPFLIDGWHRVAAMELIGIREAQAIVVKASEKDARWMAARANLEHGLPLKKSEMREVFRAYVKAAQHRKSRTEYKSYREMQKDLNIPYTTIRNWMIKDFRHIAARIGGDEDFKGKGGLQDRFPLSGIHEAAMQGLAEVFKGFQSSADPSFRGELIARMDELLAEMRRAGNWERPDF